MNKIKTIVFASVAVVMLGKLIHDLVVITRQGRAERAELSANTTLDILAIGKAHDVMLRRIENGEIRSLAALKQATDEEIIFQKIAIREDV